MQDEILIREDKAAVATLTLNLPGKLNPLSDAMIDALTGAFDGLKEDRSVRAVVLRGAGKAFCAGHDLREMTAARQAEDAGRAYFEALFARCAAMMQRIQKLPQPVIAEVQGIATAAGCQLVAHCDMAVAGESARFGVNGVDIGLFCSTPMVALSRNIARKKAFEMLTTGRFLSAAEAEAAGLVNRVVPDAELPAATAQLAATVATKLGAAVAIGKEAYYRQLEMGLADAYAYTGEVMTTNMLMRETEKGIGAFLDKRAPEWDQ